MASFNFNNHPSQYPPYCTDIFKTDEVRQLLKNKFILFIGDSVVRGMYKDLVKLLQCNDYLRDQDLKNKGEFVFEKDELLEGGQKGEMSNDITYSEVRQYVEPYHFVKFYFVTRCYSDYFRSICNDIANSKIKPDVVIMNSGCWDLTRYGPNSMKEYKKNLPLGIYWLCDVLPSYTLFIWTTTLPLSKNVQGGFMIPDIEYNKSKLREDVLEANSYARTVMKEFQLDLLDLHYYFIKQTHRRVKDGIHWDATAHRRISNIILNHICLAWDRETPGRLLIEKNPDIFVQDNAESDIDEIEEGEDIVSDSNNCRESNSYSSDTNQSQENYNFPPEIQRKIHQKPQEFHLMKFLESNNLVQPSMLTNNHIQMNLLPQFGLPNPNLNMLNIWNNPLLIYQQQLQQMQLQQQLQHQQQNPFRF